MSAASGLDAPVPLLSVLLAVVFFAEAFLAVAMVRYLLCRGERMNGKDGAGRRSPSARYAGPTPRAMLQAINLPAGFPSGPAWAA
jgi:hypothetical protein